MKEVDQASDVNLDRELGIVTRFDFAFFKGQKLLFTLDFPVCDIPPSRGKASSF